MPERYDEFFSASPTVQRAMVHYWHARQEQDTSTIRKAKTDVAYLLSIIEDADEALGFDLDPEDRIVLSQIKQDYPAK